METDRTLDRILRDDLRTHMKARDRASARVLRSVLTAIDNAGAVPAGESDEPTRDFSGERDRRVVTNEEMYTILESQIAEREQAIAVFAQHGADERADELQVEVQVLAEYRRATT